MKIPKDYLLYCLNYMHESQTPAGRAHRADEHAAALALINGLQPVETPEPADTDAAESELMLIVNELAAIQTALVSAARLMTLPPHLRDQIIISDDGEMSLMDGSHQSARDSLARRTANINAG